MRSMQLCVIFAAVFFFLRSVKIFHNILRNYAMRLAYNCKQITCMSYGIMFYFYLEYMISLNLNVWKRLHLIVVGAQSRTFHFALVAINVLIQEVVRIRYCLRRCR